MPHFCQGLLVGNESGLRFNSPSDVCGDFFQYVSGNGQYKTRIAASIPGELVYRTPRAWWELQATTREMHVAAQRGSSAVTFPLGLF